MITRVLLYLYLLMDSKFSYDHQIWITLTSTTDYLHRHTYMYMYMWKINSNVRSVYAYSNGLFTEIHACVYIIIDNFVEKLIICQNSN